ncbi:CHAP domain-containing protein [Pseudopedobacter beijingensis]|uniref:CHAP domain-containing protein n=1 Tax=Pseudopedobacter beijingensis TaxID=1207056 RepID=A0ABW4IG10_9SPHI
MAATRILLGFFCLIAIYGHSLSGGYLLKKQQADLQSRNRIVQLARNEIGVRELTGNNDGKRVAEYLKAVGLQQGSPWCAAFVSWVFRQAGFALPRTAWSPAMFNASVNVKEAQTAVVFGIYFPELKRVAHVGLVERVDGDWLMTIEGNTNVTGSREGDGVYRKRRHQKTIYRYADWVGKEGGL